MCRNPCRSARPAPARPRAARSPRPAPRRERRLLRPRARTPRAAGRAPPAAAGGRAPHASGCAPRARGRAPRPRAVAAGPSARPLYHSPGASREARLSPARGQASGPRPARAAAALPPRPAALSLPGARGARPPRPFSATLVLKSACARTRARAVFALSPACRAPPRMPVYVKQPLRRPQCPKGVLDGAGSVWLYAAGTVVDAGASCCKGTGALLAYEGAGCHSSAWRGALPGRDGERTPLAGAAGRLRALVNP